MHPERRKAFINKQRFYNGSPCPIDGTTEKYTSIGQCKACNIRQRIKRREFNLKYLPPKEQVPT